MAALLDAHEAHSRLAAWNLGGVGFDMLLQFPLARNSVFALSTTCLKSPPS